MCAWEGVLSPLLYLYMEVTVSWGFCVCLCRWDEVKCLVLCLPTVAEGLRSCSVKLRAVDTNPACSPFFAPDVHAAAAPAKDGRAPLRTPIYLSHSGA